MEKGARLEASDVVSRLLWKIFHCPKRGDTLGSDTMLSSRSISENKVGKKLP